MMPGFFFFAMILYAINPIFQIRKRTAPLIAAALVACVSDPLLLLALPKSQDASSLAIAQSGAFALAFFTLVALACWSKPVWPKLRDLVATALATLAMVALILPLRSRPPSFEILCLQIAGGLGIYGLLVAIFDIASLRSLISERFRPTVTRFRLS